MFHKGGGGYIDFKQTNVLFIAQSSSLKANVGEFLVTKMSDPYRT
jgi:hypothetical protein